LNISKFYNINFFFTKLSATNIAEQTASCQSNGLNLFDASAVLIRAVLSVSHDAQRSELHAFYWFVQ